MLTSPAPSPRRGIYYWKCDRPAAFHRTDEVHTDVARLQRQLKAALQAHFPKAKIQLSPAGGQGNHVTFKALVDEAARFVRIEDGPEQDDYLIVESRLLKEVRALGLPAPRVHAVDASREHVPFAWQLMDLVEHPDLNQVYKHGGLDLPRVAKEVGAAVAHWQCFEPEGFGPFNPEVLRQEDRLEGFHGCYEDYFFLHFERHLHFLRKHRFLTPEESQEIEAEILRHRDLLKLAQGCLVHKDLALWNILGSGSRIEAVIDWDDAISGDPMDELSLLGCFYDGPVLAQALEGYRMLRPLPEEFRRRFWLHLLRNMLVKAVIRVGAGYFDRTEGFFLIGAGGSGEDLRKFTHQRLENALHGLRGNHPIESLQPGGRPPLPVS